MYAVRRHYQVLQTKNTLLTYCIFITRFIDKLKKIFYYHTIPNVAVNSYYIIIDI